MFGRRQCAPADPVDEIAVGKFHQSLESGKIMLVEGMDMGIGEAAEKEVRFARPATPCAEARPTASRGEGSA